MKYVSTRGEAPELGFADVLLAGLARDGGLYVPKEWPRFSKDEIAAMRGLPYPDLAVRLLTPFVEGDLPKAQFEKIVHEAYATFRHEAVCPLVQIGPNLFSLELFHGPTLAFKDVAMQLLARLMDHVLAERGERATIVGATSGDTGGAAIEAFAGRERTDIFILFPHGRVSPVQQRQMTTSTAENVHASRSKAISTTARTCERHVQRPRFPRPSRCRASTRSTGRASWPRSSIISRARCRSARRTGRCRLRRATGNFGDIFAGYAAKRMGLPIERLVIATNDNDILARTLATANLPR
jgi:threonine synthase